jgi:hypothetical protein
MVMNIRKEKWLFTKGKQKAYSNLIPILKTVKKNNRIVHLF